MSVRLFVGNLPYSATEADIRQHFGAVGAPVQIVIPTDRDTGRPRGFAFVDYDDRSVAERAIQQLHGQPFKGRPLSVSEARPREARPPMGAAGSPDPDRPMGGPRPPDGRGPRRRIPEPIASRAATRIATSDPISRRKGAAGRTSARIGIRKAKLGSAQGAPQRPDVQRRGRQPLQGRRRHWRGCRSRR